MKNIFQLLLSFSICLGIQSNGKKLKIHLINLDLDDSLILLNLKQFNDMP